MDINSKDGESFEDSAIVRTNNYNESKMHTSLDFNSLAFNLDSSDSHKNSSCNDSK